MKLTNKSGLLPSREVGKCVMKLLNLFVHMYVYMYVRMYVCMYSYKLPLPFKKGEREAQSRG